MDPRPVLPKRFSDVMVDVCGPLPESEGKRYLLTVICRTSRYVEAMPMADATAAQCAAAFEDGWVRHFGLPTYVTCDNGVTFQSKLWKDLNTNLGTIVS